MISPDLLSRHNIRVYTKPNAPCNRLIMNCIVFKGTGYSIKEKSVENDGREHLIDWPTLEEKEFHFAVFNKAIEYIFSTLDMSDEEYSQTLPKLFEILEDSSLFKILSSKENPGHEEIISDHILKVSQLVKTDSLPILDKLVLRVVAPFHDLGKAFNTKRDKLQYHALISSLIMREFLTNSESSILEKIKKLDDKIDYQDFSLKVTEVIRLHHIFEKFDLGIFDLEMLVEIISGLDVILIALITFADIESFVGGENGDRYRGFLDTGVKTFNALQVALDQ